MKFYKLIGSLLAVSVSLAHYINSEIVNKNSIKQASNNEGIKPCNYLYIYII